MIGVSPFFTAEFTNMEKLRIRNRDVNPPASGTQSFPSGIAGECLLIRRNGT